MSKRHFEWAAAWIRRAGGPAQAPQEVEILIDLFLEFGARFDEARFRKACEVDKG